MLSAMLQGNNQLADDDTCSHEDPWIEQVVGSQVGNGKLVERGSEEEVKREASQHGCQDGSIASTQSGQGNDHEQITQHDAGEAWIQLHGSNDAGDQGDACYGKQTITGGASPSWCCSCLPQGSAIFLFQRSLSTNIRAVFLAQHTHSLVLPATLMTGEKPFPTGSSRVWPGSGYRRPVRRGYDAHGT